VEVLRAYTLEKHFWKNLKGMVSNLGQGKATISTPLSL